MNRKNQAHDRFFKAAFSDKDLVKDFILEFLPPDISEKLHFESLHLSNQSFITKALSAYYSDLVYTCNFGEDEDVRISLLFEHKSSIPELPHLQLLRYMLEMWESQLKNKEDLKAVIPIVLYQGKKHWAYHDFWSYFEQNENELLPYFPEFRYCLVDLSSIKDGDLLALQGKQLSFTLYLMKQVSWRTNPSEFFQIAFSQLEVNENDDLIISGIVYILQTKTKNIENLDLLLNAQPKKVRDMALTMYDQLIKKGEEKGINLMQRHIVQAGLENELSVDMMVKLTGLSEEKVQKMIAEISEKKN